MERERMVPSDVEAEEWVLGSLLIDPDAITVVETIVKPEDFYREKNRWVYEAARAISDRLEVVNQATVAAELREQSKLEDVGGPGYLAELVARCISSVWAEDYARIVQKVGFQRRLIRAGGQIARLAYEGQGDPGELLGKAQEELLALAGVVGAKGLRSIREIAGDHLAEMQQWLDHPGEVQGLPTGFVDVEATIGGLEAGRMYVIAARPSMGKSMLALAMAANVAAKGTGVAIFTLEMSELALLYRLVLSKARVNRYGVRIGQAELGWQHRVWEAYGELEKLPIWIDDTGGLTTADARARVAQLKTRCPNLGLVVWDYGELAGDDDADKEELRVSKITRRLKGIGKALDLAVLAVYQLNREVDKRGDRRPVLADLRYSGMIEQEADVVMLLYRRAYYAEREKHITIQPGEQNLLEVIIAKHRDGPTGVVKLFFDPKTGHIGNWQEE